MKYKYQAKTREGELQVGYVEAANRDSAVTVLAGHNLFILSVEEAEKVRWYDRLADYFTGIRGKDMVVFSRTLAMLLGARLSLGKTLAVLERETAHPNLREAAGRIADDVNAGLSFSQALERQGAIFSPFFVSMVRSAEVTGNLDHIAGFLADYIEREEVLRSRARSALIYPGIIVSMFLVVAFIMVAFVFPQIKPVFEQAGVALPLFSQIFIFLGEFITRFWILVLLVGLVLLTVIADYLRTPEGRAFIDDLKIRLPLASRIFLPITITRFANAASTLLNGGIPVPQAMEIVGQTVDNVLYRDVLRDISEDVRGGMPLSESIAKRPEYFPAFVSQLIAVGEETGELDQVMSRIAVFYGREADAVVTNLVEILQPVLMIGIGTLVGLLFASVLLPLYKLTATIQ